MKGKLKINKMYQKFRRGVPENFGEVYQKFRRGVPEISERFTKRRDEKADIYKGF